MSQTKRPILSTIQRRGVTLAEGLVMLAIGAILLLIVAYVASTMRNNAESQGYTTTTQVLMTALRKARTSGNFAGITAAEICTQLSPQNCPNGTLTIGTKGDTTVAVGDTTIGGISYARLTISNFPKTACKDAIASIEPELAEITVNSQPIKSATTAYVESALTTNCAGLPAVTAVLTTRGM